VNVKETSERSKNADVAFLYDLSGLLDTSRQVRSGYVGTGLNFPIPGFEIILTIAEIVFVILENAWTGTSPLPGRARDIVCL
jgi:hypothetical protein